MGGGDEGQNAWRGASGPDQHQGRWKEAEELEVGVMETRKRVLGEEYHIGNALGMIRSTTTEKLFHNRIASRTNCRHIPNHHPYGTLPLPVQYQPFAMFYSSSLTLSLNPHLIRFPL